jgi:diguanylate cyclase (GGDEF)-like protein
MTASAIQIFRQELERILRPFGDPGCEMTPIAGGEGVEAIFLEAATTRDAIDDAIRSRVGKMDAEELIGIQSLFHAKIDGLLFTKVKGLIETRVAALTEQAERDPVTLLPNRSAFNRALRGEMERARRYHREMSLVLFDVDRFKSVNDQFGHPAGDRTLAQVASVLKSSLRQSDAVFRYGGDEFAAICPETSGEAISRALHRLEAIMPTWRAESCLPDHLDISWGVASFPADGSVESELVDIADRRLYVCKHARRRSPATVL